MKMLIKVLLWLRSRAENLIALLLASMFCTFLVQVVFRYLLNLPLGWTVEYETIAWLWGILFGYAFVVRNDDVIRLDLVYYAVPIPVRRGMDLVSNLVVSAVLLWSLPKVYGYVTFMHIERTAFMRIPFDLVFSIYVPFVVAVVIRNLVAVWWALRGIGYDPVSHQGQGAHENV
jgi:TRAP-type C4-dicarboxylate transport system permease small subunit